MDYYKNKLLNELLEVYYDNFSKTLDTADYVPRQYTKKINKYIFKNMKRAFKRLDKEDKIHCKAVAKKLKLSKRKAKKERKEIAKQEKIKKKKEKKVNKI